MDSKFLSGSRRYRLSAAQSILRRNSPPRQASLWRNNPTQRVTARQYDAAMIHFRREAGGMVECRHSVPLNQGPSAHRAPAGFGVEREHGMAMAADTFHI
jgi:hypothetical protein